MFAPLLFVCIGLGAAPSRLADVGPLFFTGVGSAPGVLAECPMPGGVVALRSDRILFVRTPSAGAASLVRSRESLRDWSRTPADGGYVVAVRPVMVGTRGFDLIPGERPSFPVRRATGPRGAVRELDAYRDVTLRSEDAAIDLVLRAGRCLSYDVVDRSNRAEGSFEFECEGATGVSVAADGRLVIDTPYGPIEQSAPEVLARDENDPARRRAAAWFERTGANRYAVRWRRGATEPDVALTIAPSVLLATYFGGSGNDACEAIAIDPTTSETYVVGMTSSPGNSIPTTSGSFQTTYAGGLLDACVVGYASSGTSVKFMTLIGGSNLDAAFAVDLDSAGDLVVAGATLSGDFPTTSGAYDTTFNSLPSTSPQADAFVVKLDASGAGPLVFGTYLGASFLDAAWGVDVADDDSVWVVGVTESDHDETTISVIPFPVTSGAYQPTYGTMQISTNYGDGFFSRLNASGATLSYSSFVGGIGGDGALAVVAKSGAELTTLVGTDSQAGLVAHATGLTQPFGSDDEYVASFDVRNTGSAQLTFGAFLGGSLSDNPGDLDVDADGRIYVTGQTHSTDFLSQLGMQGSLSGSSDAYVVRLLPNGSPVVEFATYYGGNGIDFGTAIRVDRTGKVHVAGTTFSTGLPGSSTATFGPSPAGGADFFIARYSSGSPSLLDSNFWGGSSDDSALGIALAPNNRLLVCGTTNSSSLSTTGAPDSSFASAGAPYATQELGEGILVRIQY